MGRQERPLPPGPLHEFAAELRALRAAAGVSYRELSRRAGYSPSALSAAAAGEMLPTLPVTLAYVGACDGDQPAWERRWSELAAQLRRTDPGLVSADDAPAGDTADPAPETGTRVPAARDDAARDDAVGEGRPPVVSLAVVSLAGDDPRRVGPYRLLGRLGAGAMGRVYLGRHRRGGALAAVKVVRAELADDATFRHRFARELTVLRTVASPHVAPVIDADPTAARPWLATAYTPAITLEQAIETAGPLPPATVTVLAAGLARALVALHRAGVVHRDLKPSNVLLCADGPRLIDLGIARTLDGTQLTATGTHLGSAAFMAPEQALGDPVGPAADVFSLGALIAYAATGAPPFGEGNPESVLYRVVHTDPDLTALTSTALTGQDNNPFAGPTAAALAKDPARRPTADQLAAALPPAPVPPGGWLPAPLATRIATAGTPPAARRPQPRTVVTVGLAPLLLVAAIIAAVLIAGHNSASGRQTTLIPTDPASAGPLTGTPATQPSTSRPTLAQIPQQSVPATLPSTQVAAPPAGARAVAVTQLGAPDFNGYCHATGQGGVHLVANNAYGWRCTADNGTGDDAQAVCVWTYHTTHLTNRVANFNDPTSWQCWQANRQLGPLDFTSYCQQTGHTGATTTGTTAYSWYCTGDSNGIDTQAACRQLYHVPAAVSRFQNYYDRNTWQCWD